MGKTNYLMRLWLAIHGGNSGIKSDGLPDDIKYLQAGSDMLLKGKFAPRTLLDDFNKSEILFKISDESSARRGKLIFPDYNGEMWEKIFQAREWSGEWDKNIRDTCGCLIFIRAGSDQIVAPLDWMMATELFGSAAPSLSEDKPFEIPTQVMLVDWLQFLRDAFTKLESDKFIPRVGIIVSAWDLVAEDQKEAGPDEWLMKEFPMFSQYIEANSSKFDFATFGVSIVGGDFDKDLNFRTNYLDQNPHESGFVVSMENGELETSSDITMPLVWALGLNS